MSLSAYLAQATGSAKYTQAAYAAGSWIARANTNAAGLPLDTINGRTCVRSDASWVFTYNAGKYVEGLTALYGATKNSSLLAECVLHPVLRVRGLRLMDAPGRRTSRRRACAPGRGSARTA
jgi:predicted alpha-1,6-mannanase (GH76 family)